MSLGVEITHVPWLADRRANVTKMRRQIAAWAPGVRVGVTEDKGWKSCWLTVRKAMVKGALSSQDHLLVLADDFRFHERSFSELERAIAAYPNQLIQPFAVRAQFVGAAERWGVTDMVWGSCIVWPVPLIGEFLAWDREFMRPELEGDDMRIRAWLTYTGRSNYLTNPSLFDHLDRELSSAMGFRTPLPRVARTLRLPDGAVDWDGSPVLMLPKVNKAKDLEAVVRPEKWREFCGNTYNEQT